MKVKACVNSGLCCLKGPCAYGKWDEENGRCVYLVLDDKGRSKCSEYARIIKEPLAEINPAFGFGCCMGMFNERRQVIIDRDYAGDEQYIDIVCDL